MNTEIVIEVLRHAMMITGFVMLVMLIIEYLNVQTRGSWSMKLKTSPWIQILESHMDLALWVRGNLHIVLILALIVGLIPESGPHMVFISLFVAGTIPLSILIVNSIVQDGHGSLPLLAESKKSFFLMKSVNVVIGLLVGLLGMYTGW